MLLSTFLQFKAATKQKLGIYYQACSPKQAKRDGQMLGRLAWPPVGMIEQPDRQAVMQGPGLNAKKQHWLLALCMKTITSSQCLPEPWNHFSVSTTPCSTGNPPHPPSINAWILIDSNYARITGLEFIGKARDSQPITAYFTTYHKQIPKSTIQTRICSNPLYADTSPLSLGKQRSTSGRLRQLDWRVCGQNYTRIPWLAA